MRARGRLDGQICERSLGVRLNRTLEFERAQELGHKGAERGKGRICKRGLVERDFSRMRRFDEQRSVLGREYARVPPNLRAERLCCACLRREGVGD